MEKADGTPVWTIISSCTSEEEGKKVAEDQEELRVDQELHKVSPSRNRNSTGRARTRPKARQAETNLMLADLAASDAAKQETGSWPTRSQQRYRKHEGGTDSKRTSTAKRWRRQKSTRHGKHRCKQRGTWRESRSTASLTSLQSSDTLKVKSGSFNKISQKTSRSVNHSHLQMQYLDKLFESLRAAENR